MRPTPHEELTDPENEKILGTLTAEAWRGFAVEAVVAKWYALDPECRHLMEAPSALELLIHQGLQTSGAIGGKHREDLTRAIVGAQPPSTGLSVNLGQPQPAQPTQPQKRGFEG